MRRATEARLLPSCRACRMATTASGVRRVERRFWFCSSAVAHRQLSGWYPFILSTRSIVFPGGLGPMSARKSANDLRQRSHTVMPRPPYLSLVSAAQRSITARHVQYSGVSRPAWPWSVRALSRHPHERVRPRRKLLPSGVASLPQSHRHRQRPALPRAAGAIAVRRPNLSPVKSRAATATLLARSDSHRRQLVVSTAAMSRWRTHPPPGSLLAQSTASTAGMGRVAQTE